jgi:Mg-chelatase subunit ChlD
LAGEGAANLKRSSLSQGFKGYINTLREKGMDVVFAMDSTSSMVPFIEEARRVVDHLITKLAAVVPNLRLALVAYRDEGDDFITRHLDLTSDRYEILNFMDDCKAEGGGDFPEAVCEALNRSINTLMWRPKAKKVIILIGDAPFHPKDSNEIDRLLRAFSNQEEPGVVNTIYIGPLNNPMTEKQKTAVDSMKHIAQVARGEFTWISEQEKLVRHLIKMAFGSRWEVDVAKLLDSMKKDRMALLIERKAKTGQKAWLLEGLKKVPVRSGIVQALIRDAEQKDLEHLVEYLVTERIPMETKWAALYILRKVLRRDFEYRPYQSPDGQRKELLLLTKAIEAYEPQLR